MEQAQIDAHWEYISQLLRTHGENEQVIEKIGFHYRTAMAHGAKHEQAKDVEK